MRERYRSLLQTEAVEAAQREAYGVAAPRMDVAGDGGELGRDERQFIAERDSFYMATVSEDGWPYVQHRGGPAGFLKVLDGRRLAFADYEGNRQLISVGNLAGEERVSLFLMDYVARERMKVLGLARVWQGEAKERFREALGLELDRARRVVEIEVVGFDWNCPKWITQRFTRVQVEAAMGKG